MLKPLIDMTWNHRFHFIGQSISLQGVLGTLAAACGSLIALAAFPTARKKERMTAACFIAASAFLLLHAQLRPLHREAALRYWASASGFVLIPWTLKTTPPQWIRRGFFLSLAVLGLTLVLQMLNVTEWRSFDQCLFLARGALQSKVEEFGRLSGLYYHPLDLIRVLLWPALILVFLSLKDGFSASRVSALLALGFVFYRTTHRTTLIFFGLTPLLLGHFLKANRAAAKAVTAILAGALLSALTCWAFEKIRPGEIWNLGSFVRNENQETLHYSALTKSEVRNPLEFGRGRSNIWLMHARWISLYAPSELFLGSEYPAPPQSEQEPHNQFLDWIERFGLVGLFGLSLYFFGLPFALDAPRIRCWALVWAFFVYSNITEILVMPTMAWWGLLFLHFDSWLPTSNPFQKEPKPDANHAFFREEHLVALPR